MSSGAAILLGVNPIARLASISIDCPDPDDLARFYCELLGLEEAAFQPAPDRWRVMLDPAGHPFCLSTDRPD